MNDVTTQLRTLLEEWNERAARAQQMAVALEKSANKFEGSEAVLYRRHRLQRLRTISQVLQDCYRQVFDLLVAEEMQRRMAERADHMGVQK